MTAIAQELTDIVGTLSEDKAREVIDFARFLQQQAHDAAWEKTISDSRPRPRLDAFVADALREGKDEPLDPSKL